MIFLCLWLGSHIGSFISIDKIVVLQIIAYVSLPFRIEPEVERAWDAKAGKYVYVCDGEMIKANKRDRTGRTYKQH